MELVLNTTSGALWSGPTSTYLNVVTVRFITIVNQFNGSAKYNKPNMYQTMYNVGHPSDFVGL